MNEDRKAVKPMDAREAVQMMGRCLGEIELLRRTVAELAPKAAAYNAISKILGLIPDRHDSVACEDLVWVLKKRIAELQEQPKNDV
jgi:hypothetical protein